MVSLKEDYTTLMLNHTREIRCALYKAILPRAKTSNGTPYLAELDMQRTPDFVP